MRGAQPEDKPLRHNKMYFKTKPSHHGCTQAETVCFVHATDDGPPFSAQAHSQ